MGVALPLATRAKPPSIAESRAMSEHAANLQLMTKAARAAGRHLRRDFAELQHLQRSAAGARDFARRAGDKAEQSLEAVLRETRPNYGWASPSKGQTQGSDPTRFWIVNAISGATNFAHGLPHWAISIALERRGNAVVAVIYDALSNELFHTEEGGGSWLNDTRIRVSRGKPPQEMLVATNLDGERGAAENEADFIGVRAGVKGLRALGAPALDLAYVASGRLDGYWDRTPERHDTAAALLLLSGAGGIAEGVAHGSVPGSETGLIASAGESFERFSALIRPDDSELSR